MALDNSILREFAEDILKPIQRVIGNITLWEIDDGKIRLQEGSRESVIQAYVNAYSEDN